MTNVQADFTALSNNATAALADNKRRSTVMLQDGMFTRVGVPAESQSRVIKTLGKLAAEARAEDTTSTLQKVTEGSVTLTLGKIVSVSRLTEEALQFSGQTATPQWFVSEQVKAILEEVENSIAQLGNTFTNEVLDGSGNPITGAAMDIPTILAGALLVHTNTNGSNPYTSLKCVLSPKSAYEALKTSQIANNNSSILANPNSSVAAAVDATPQTNGFITNVAGVSCYESFAITDDGTDYTNMIYHPSAIVGAHQDQVKVRGDDDVLNWADVFGSCLFSGFTVYDQDRAVKLKTAV